MKCHFDYEGIEYTVDSEAEKRGADIRLPDGRLLRPGGWEETFPPIPVGLRPTPDTGRPIYKAARRRID